MSRPLKGFLACLRYAGAAIGGLALGVVLGGPRWGVPLGLALLSVFVGAIVCWTVLWPSWRARRLLKVGEPASATVLETWDADVARSGDLRIGLRLEVRPEDRPPFRVKTELLGPRSRAPLFQPGAVLQVRYDPRDTSRVAVERLGHRRPAAIPEGEVVFDGQTYAGVGDMPPHVRRAYEKVQAVLGGAYDGGIPDAWEGVGRAADLRPGRPALSRVQRLRELREMLQAGLITDEEYEAKKGEIVSEM